MAKRVFEIAKELGVKSKAVVEKCHHEGIPETLIRLSVGIEDSGGLIADLEGALG